MTSSMHKRKLLIALFLLPCCGWGQATSTASVQAPQNGLNFPAINGSFQYGLSAAEVIQDGYSGNGDIYAETSLSGNLAYTSRSEIRPLSLIYTGGLQFGDQSGFSNTYYQSFAISQGYVTRGWVFSLSDSVSYLPQSPTVGLSGIPGTGDVGLDPVQNGLEPAQTILSIGNSRLSNSVGGNAERRLDAFTSISGGATYGILHFLGNGGLDSSQISAAVSVNRRIDARSSASLSASYGTFMYGSLGNGASFNTRGLSAGYQRQLSRSLSASVSGGPEWISSSNTLSIPSRLTFTAGAGLSYGVRVYRAAISYSRAVNGGAGVQPGGISDSVIGSIQRPFGNAWSTSANIGYGRTQGLSNTPTPTDLAVAGLTTNGTYDSVFAGGQVTRRISRSVSAYASYTALTQSFSQPSASPVALNGIVQSFALGISYFPRSLHLGQF